MSETAADPPPPLTLSALLLFGSPLGPAQTGHEFGRDTFLAGADPGYYNGLGLDDTFYGFPFYDRDSDGGDPLHDGGRWVADIWRGGKGNDTY